MADGSSNLHDNVTPAPSEPSSGAQPSQPTTFLGAPNIGVPSWLHSHLNIAPPLTQVTGERVDAWNVATWTPGGLHIVAGAHDRTVAERLADEYTDEARIPGTFIVIRGGSR